MTGRFEDMDEFLSAATEMPKSFRSIQVRLALVIETSPTCTNVLDISDQVRLELPCLTLAPTSSTTNYSLGLNPEGALQIKDRLFVGPEAKLMQLQEWLNSRSP